MRSSSETELSILANIREEREVPRRSISNDFDGPPLCFSLNFLSIEPLVIFLMESRLLSRSSSGGREERAGVGSGEGK